MTPGRKRTFNKEDVLDKAMRVFWDNGYAGTSMSDLTSALGINKPSLYAAFGNKEQLFQAAMQHYIEHYGSPLLKYLNAPIDVPFKERLENYLNAVIELNSSDTGPKGCFVVKSCCESGGVNVPEEITATTQHIGDMTEKILMDIMTSEQQKGEISKTANVKALASHVLTLMYGLAVMARRGKSYDELRSIVRMAINTMDLTE